MKKIDPVGISVTLLVLMWLAAVVVFGYLPDQVPVHWDVAGNVDGYGSSLTGAFLWPLLGTVAYIAIYYLPLLDPRVKNLTKFRESYAWFLVVFVIFMLGMYGFSLSWALGYPIPVYQALLPLMTLLFVSIGYLLDRAEPNWFIGVRTPWTLSNDEVWKKTHKFSAQGFKIAGLVMLVGLLFPNLTIWFILVPILFVALGSIVYSYVLYTELK